MPPIKSHCPQGHPYSGSNLYVDSRERKHCRACMRARTKAWYQQVDGPRQATQRAADRQSYQPPPLRTPSYDAGFGHWLSGFTDGEASFMAGAYGRFLTIRFGITLRADDGAILEQIRRTLGVGQVHYRERGPCELRASPRCDFAVVGLANLYTVIVPQFDTYPLRAKKARDYAIWREIIMIVASHRRGRGTILEKEGARLLPLIERLKEGRHYNSTYS